MQTASLSRGIVLDADKLPELRRQRGLKQVDLAVASGVSEAGISRAERSQSISLESAGAIAAFFNATVGELSAAAPAPELPKPPDPEPIAPRPGSPPVAAMSNIPIRVPKHFMGRDTALAEIDEALARYEGRVAITALHGLRGVGKTVLAAAYAERHTKDYRATWWLRAETESGMRADLVGLGVRLGWVDPEEKEEPALAAVMERLAHEGDGNPADLRQCGRGR